MICSRRKINGFLLYSFFCILLATILVFDVSIVVIANLLIINICIQIIVLYLLKIEIFSIGSVFVLLGQFFEFSVVILYAYSYDFSNYVVYQLSRVSEKSLMEATKYAFLCVITVFWGLIIGKQNRSRSKNECKNNKDEKVFYRRMGNFCTGVFGIIWIIIQIYNFYLTRFGYITNIYNTIPSTYITLSSFMYVGLFFLMIYYKTNYSMRKARMCFIIAVVCAVVSMLAGVRSTGMCIIILLFIYYDRCINRINKANLLKVFIAGFFLLALLTAIMHLRKGDFSLINLFQEWWLCIKSNVIFNVLEEFGLSIFVLAHEFSNYEMGIFEHQPINIILHELVVSIPGLSNISPELVNEGYCNLGLNSLGCTYIADIYYYLGYGGIAFTFIFGLWISQCDNKLDNLVKEKRYVDLGMRWIFYLTILGEIRSPFRFGYKVFILSSIMMFVIKKIVGSRRYV